MAKSVKTKNPIYIGLDGKGPLIEVQIKFVNGKYEVEQDSSGHHAQPLPCRL